MTAAPKVELVLGLLVTIASLGALALRLRLPYPVVLVLGGLAIGAVPGVPRVRLDPDLVFFAFLPPLVYAAAYRLSPVELRVHARTILLLAVGLVLATTVAVAVAAHLVIGIAWGPSFVLGAVLGPTDPISATALVGRLGAPPRLATILEGESLTNDGTALVTYKIALGAVAAGGLSVAGGAARFVAVAVGGAAVGLAIGALSAALRRPLDEPRLELTVSLLTPFAAYLLADRLGASGVLAAVAAGLYVGHRFTSVHAAETRVTYVAVWDVLAFLLNALLFLLIGLELPAIADALGSRPATALLRDGLVVSGAVIAVRLTWMLSVGALVDRHDRRGGTGGLRERLVVAWSSMRGGVSLAAALAVPLAVGGRPFPDRDLLVLMTFVTILVTLVVPGLTLPLLIRALGLAGGDERRRQEAAVRAALARGALSRLDELARSAGCDGAPSEPAARLRALYEARLARAAPQGEDGPAPHDDDGAAGYRRLRRALIDAERAALDDLLRRGEVSAEVAWAIQRELDLEEARAGR